MKLPAIVPQIGREAVIVLGGALLAALALRLFPTVKQYIKDGWR
jgi:hypothetical protein